MSDNRLRVRVSVALAVCLSASSCGEDGRCDPADVSCSDNTAPTVVSIDPPNGATNVARLPSVTVTFSEPVDPASFTAGALVVGSSTGTVNVAGSTATFTPASQLPEGALSSVHVEGVKDLAGNAMASAFTSSFTTRFEPLSAIAGPDQSVNRGAPVQLDASSSSATGAMLAWTQLGGPAVGALSGATPTFTAPQEVATVRLELALTRGAETKRDTVIIWVLEDVAHTWWVSSAGDDANAGTRAQPKATIQAAVEAANAAGDGSDVYVAGGAYTGNLELRSRVSIYGGFDPATWIRDIAAHRAMLSGAVHGSADSLFLEGLEIRAADAVDSGASSIALHLHNSRGIVIRRNVIVAGAGAVGLTGAAGADGANGSNGGSGNSGGVCIPGSFITPGAGGASFSAGGPGGGGRVLGGDDGTGGTGPAGNGGGGANDQAGNGASGFGGGEGGLGEDGSGGAAFGAVGPTGYAPSNGTDATDGTNGGGGGGGGGAGGFIITGIVNVCGPSGGGGGGGGQRSRGGKAGGGGGASIGVLLTGSTDAEVIDNSVTTGGGGAGGKGGRRGTPGDGGAGGPGKTVLCDETFPSFCTGYSGNGGSGGFGGFGGTGGGGGGGPSIGVMQSVSSTVVISGNVFTLGAAGAGGSGGNPGAAGQRAEHLTN